MTFIGHAFARAGSRLLTEVQAALGAAARLPAHPKSAEPEGPLALWRWIEDNGDVVFPAIGFVIFVLVVVAVRRSAVNQESELKALRGKKDAIVRLMRARLSLTADQTATELGVNRYQAATMLDELVKEGALVQGRLPGGVINYRLKGL